MRHIFKMFEEFLLQITISKKFVGKMHPVHGIIDIILKFP